jgi:hypothetical protein
MLPLLFHQRVNLFDVISSWSKSHYLFVSVLVLSCFLINPSSIVSAQSSASWNLPLEIIFESHSLPLEIAVHSESTFDFDFDFDVAAPPQPPMGLYTYILGESTGIFTKLFKSTVPPVYPYSWIIEIKPITIQGMIEVNLGDEIEMHIPSNLEIIVSNSTHSFNAREVQQIKRDVTFGKTYQYTVTVSLIDVEPDPPPKKPNRPTKPDDVNSTEIEAFNETELVTQIIEHNITEATYLFTSTNTEKTTLVENLVEINHTSTIAEILIIADTNTTNDVLVDLDPEICAKVITEMSSIDLETTAHRVEDAIKNTLKFENNTEKEIKLRAITQSIKQMQQQPLLDLLVSIAHLPETPSTVSRILENLELSETKQIVLSWLDQGPTLRLSDVISLMNDDYLLALYPTMPSVSRNSLKSILPVETVLLLHSLNDAIITGFSMKNTTFYENEVILINTSIQNIGIDTFDYTSTLTLNTIPYTYHSETIPENETIYTPIFIEGIPIGEYTLGLGNHSSSLVIQKVPIPIIECTQLTLSTLEPEIGKPFNVSFTLQNSGDSGKDTISLYLDGNVLYQQEVRVKNTQPNTITVPVSIQRPGEHTLSVKEISTSFFVNKPSYSFGWYLFTLVLSLAMLTVIYRARESL